MDQVYERVSEALEARGQTWAWMGRQIACTDQTVNNWRRRGVPPSRYAELAHALGWTIEQLLGIEGRVTSAPDAGAPPPVPPRGFKDRNEVSDSDFAMLQAFKVSTTEDEKRDILKRHQTLLEQARESLENAKR